MPGIKAFVESHSGTLSDVPERYTMPNQAPDVSEVAVLPIVDVKSDTFENDLVDACKSSGMFYLKNHGIHTQDAMDCALEFFNAPSEDKMQYYTEEIFTPVRYCTSMMPSKEVKLEWHDHLQMWLKEDSLDDHPWPKFPLSFKEAGSNYARNIFKLGRKMLCAMSQGLGLPKSRLIEAFEDMVLLTRANYYPPCPNPRQALGMEGHTDSGGLSFVLQDGVGGLQLKQGEKWYNVRPLEGMLVVNMGDQLEKLSNGAYKSILHRVMVNSKSSRLSLGAFLGPSLEAEIGPIEELLNENNPAKYRSRTYKEYMNEVYTQHFSGKNVHVA